MKVLRLAIAALALLAACDTPDPVVPSAGPRHNTGPVVGPPSSSSPPCDTSCPRIPAMGGGGG